MYVNTIYKQIARYNLKKKYSDEDIFDKGTNPYVSMLLNNVIENKNTEYCARYRDCMIYDYIDEFMKRFYTREESTGRLPGIAKYYKNYIKFMCKPTLRNFRANSMLHQYADHKAELYHCRNYDGKGRNKDKINYQTILTDSIKENINENIITRIGLDCEELQFFTESVNKENASINLDEHSLAELGYNEYLASVRSNKEESLLFLLGKFEDRKINEKFCKKNIITSTQSMSNYDRTTTDYSMKTVKESTASDLKKENKKSHLGNLNVKEGDNDLKMKLTNIIQDINSKTRNRNICNDVATVSLIKDNSVTTTYNKIHFVKSSLTSTNTEKKNPSTKTNLTNSKFNTFHSKNQSNPSEMISNLKKFSVNAIKNLKLRKLDFKIMNTVDTAVIFKSQKENLTAQCDTNVNNIRSENKLHKAFELKFSQNEKKNSFKLNNDKQNTNIERIKSPKLSTGNNNPKSSAVNFDSKQIKDNSNHFLLTSRIQNLQKDNPKSRNINPVLNQDRSSINKSNDNFKTEIKGVVGSTNPYTKSFKINLDIPSKCDDLRSRIYGSYDSSKYLNNFITDSNKNLFKQLSISKNNKSPINQPQILIKNKANQNLHESKKKSDSTCDKSNHLTYNSIKSKEIFSTISFQKNSGEAASNLKKESTTPTCASNSKINSKEFMTKDFSKNTKTNLLRAFNSCSSSTTQSKLSSSNKIKFQIKNNKK